MDMTQQAALHAPQIHPTAICSQDVQYEEGVIIGPYCILEGPIFLGRGCHVHAHAKIQGPVVFGQRNSIASYAFIGCDSQDRKYMGEKDAVLQIGDDNIFREYATISRGNDASATVIGSHNRFMAYTHVGHDCKIGNHNRFANNAALAGHVDVADYVIVSGLSGVHQFVKIGSYAFIGGGALVVKDVPPFMMVGSEPTRLAGLNLVGLERNGFTQEQRFILKKYYRALFKDSLQLHQTAQELLDCLSSEEEFVRPLMEFILSSQRGIMR